MTRNKLLHIISESIKKHLNESYVSSGLDNIFQEVSIKAEQYRRYAEQLESEIKVVGNICNDIADAVNTTFGMQISGNNFQNCDYSGDELLFDVFIPAQNFLSACKRNEEAMRYFQEEGGKSESDLIACGIDCDWELYTSDGTSLGDSYHNVRFTPETFNTSNNVVVCNVSVDNAFITYD